MKNKDFPEIVQKIWSEAVKAREKSYAPYSNFRVGAAFRIGETIYSGTNVENASYGACVCAERIAIFKALNEGQKKNIEDLVVVTSTKNGVAPCGLCLQVLSEFCSPD